MFGTMQFSLLNLVVFALFVTSVTSDGFYKVIGPRTVRPNSEFHVAVSTHSTSVPTTVSAAVVGTTLHGKAFSVEESATVLPYSTNIIRLKIDDIEDGVYKLVARGSGGVQFQSTSTLEYVKKSYSVLIQTDKSVYNPGHKLLFRALILNSDLKPASEVRSEPISVYISDDKGHKVKEWRRIIAPRGVFSEELQLSRRPNLGNWNISVQIRDQVYNKTIMVAEYVEPKLMIQIDAPKHLTFQENVLTANIKAQYKSGKKVRGDATVTVYPTINSGVIQPIFQNPVRKVYPIDGALTVNFDIAKELKLSDEYERTVVIDVIIEESLTGRRQNHSVEVQLHKYDYKMELIKTANYFKPGMTYTTYIKVSNHDGSPLSNDRRSVGLQYGFSRVDDVYTKHKIVLDRNGMFKLELQTPLNANNQTALRVEADYYDLYERLPPVPAAVSFSNNFMQISIETERPIVNQDIEVLVNCTERMKYISYVLMGRGDVIIANSIRVDNLREYRFHFTATHAMVPISHLLVDYVREDGEMISDSIDIQVEGILQNFIDLQTNAVETSPGTDIDITIRSQPNSYIGLMAIDENMNMIKKGHDLNQDMVANELYMYDAANASPYLSVLKGSKTNYFWKQGSSNARDMYYYSGASILTNSFLTSRRPSLEDIYLRPVHYDASTVKPDRGVGLPIYSVTRPPLEGPYAFSRIPKPVWDRPKVYLMNEVADTWLFNNFSSGFEGKTSIRRRIPSTLNTWSITGFSVSPLHGLGLVSTPKKIKVSKLFSVTMELPYVVQRGETVQVVVVVQNQMDKDVTAEITLHNPEQKFVFAEVSNDINGTVQRVELYRRKRTAIKKNNSASVAFSITPLRIGPVELKATASSSSNQDSNIRVLNVKAEGETLHFTKTVFIDLTRSNTYKGNVSIEIPKNVVPNSENIEVSVVGDFIGPILMNLDEVIRLPTASGEQNLVHFVPDLIVLKYLQNTQQLTPTIENEAIKNLETNYQQQLSYRTNQGGFSVFGKDHEVSSLWITAYTAMSLAQARNYIYIEERIITSAYEFLSNAQNLNGSFVERSAIIHKDVQSSDTNSLALTAFVTLSFMENEHPESKYSNTINKALDYIARNLDEADSEYTVAICAYVLQLANHPSKLSALNLLDSKAQFKDNKKWWSKPYPRQEEKNPWHKLPKSMDIEATSYALLTLFEANLIEDAMPVLTWLNDQRNNLGGFTSSQDTRIALYALYRVALKLGLSSNCQIEFTYRKQEVRKFNINRDSAIIVQKAQLGSSARDINITASGSGFALFQVSYEYNMNVTGPWPLFTLDPQVDKNSDRYHLQLSICTAFATRNLTDTPESNMAVMEVHLPSGFTADVDALPSLEVSQHVQKVETKNMDTTVVLYFNNLTVHEYCPTVSAFQTHKVANQKPVPVVIYDYYDSSRRARIFYRGRRSSLCDICEDADCGNVCAAEAEKQRAEESKDEPRASNIKDSAVVSMMSTLILVVAMSFHLFL